MLNMKPFASADLSAARDAVKAYARVAQDGEDALIEELAASALLVGEAFCRRIGLVREAVEILPITAEWKRLSAGPVQAITAVEGLPAEGASFAMPVGSYGIDIDADGAGWVRVTAPGAAGRVRITYQAGLANSWAELPGPLRQGTLRLATHLYAHREDVRDFAPPAAVVALWRPWRRLAL
jgi:uncharacterized phiE125 gp8 family phage protein